MRTRTRTDSTAGQRLDFSWDNDEAFESAAVNPPGDDKAEDGSIVPENQQVPPPVNETQEQQPEQDNDSSDASSAVAAGDASASQAETEKEAAATLQSPAMDTPPEPQSMQDREEPSLDSAASQSQKKQKQKLSRVTQSTSIVADETSLGHRMKEFRENANVSIEDLARRLHITTSLVQDLENGDYESLSHSFTENNAVYIVATLKDICNELGISKNETDELVDQYYNEVSSSGYQLFDSKATEIPDKTENADNDSPFNVREKEPIIKKLPKLLVFLLLVFIVLFIFMSIVMPYVKVARKPQQHKLDFAPLIPPEKTPPTIIDIP